MGINEATLIKHPVKMPLGASCLLHKVPSFDHSQVGISVFYFAVESCDECNIFIYIFFPLASRICDYFSGFLLLFLSQKVASRDYSQ